MMGKNETITYIMILAIPKDKKDDLYQKLNNARCLSEEEHIFENAIIIVDFIMKMMANYTIQKLKRIM